MAFFRCSMNSEAMGGEVRYLVLLPSMKSYHLTNPKTKPFSYESVQNLKTLVLLHGVTSCGEEWLHHTGIVRYAEWKHIAVVIPEGKNSYYTDQPGGPRYGTFIGDELMQAVRAFFPLSARREDTVIAGLSMGGYGAVKTALKYPENFGTAVSLSGTLNMLEIVQNPQEKPFFRTEKFFHSRFGDLTPPAVLEHDLLTLFDRNSDRGIQNPAVDIKCGTEDHLYEMSLWLRDSLMERDAEVSYEEGPGSHTWKYWDGELEKVVRSL